MKLNSIVISKLMVLPVALWLSATSVLAIRGDGSFLPSKVKNFTPNMLSTKVDTLSLVFVGDLMQHQAQINAAKKGKDAYDYRNCFQYVAPELQKADLAIGNLEVTFGGKPYRGYPSFSAPDAYLKALQAAGFDMLLFANNHCLDRGNRGAIRTLNLLDSLNFIHTGVFRTANERLHRYPLLVERNGFRIVFLNYTYDTNGLRPNDPLIVNYTDKKQIRKDVIKARLMRPDAIIACMHWGIEYELFPRKGEREMVDYLLSLGVDHVIGGHPHVVQPLGLVTDSLTASKHLVAYSLGNFISNMSAPYTDGGMVVRMVLKKVGYVTRMVDCKYSYVWTSRPELNHSGQFFVYPSTKCSENDNLLNVNEKQRMERYLKNVRKVVSRDSMGVKEYFF